MNYIAQISFNSTMVRLKVFIYVEAFAMFVFQFHNGSIKRLSIILIIRTANRFQFHNGSIKRRKGLLCKVSKS